MTERVGAIVLAGGRSSRFGRDKLAEPIDGRPMVEHTISAVRVVSTEVIVVGPRGATRELPADVMAATDDRPFEGPLAGLAAGFRALDPSIEQVLVVGGDMPTLVPAVLTRLVAGLEAHEAAVLADDVGPRPLPMAVRRSAAAPVADELLAAGERRLRALLAVLDVEVIAPSSWRRDDPDGASLRDVDTPDDLPSGG
jgi:molybdopterin-guanine dinucleotide biosynthesis protein A